MIVSASCGRARSMLNYLELSLSNFRPRSLVAYDPRSRSCDRAISSGFIMLRNWYLIRDGYV